MTRPQPSDFAVLVAALMSGQEWLAADVIRDWVKRFGFDHLQTQPVAAWLGRMCREPCPRFESRIRFSYREYRVTRYGRTEFFNTSKGLRVYGELFAA